jgi:hypothetical protein
MRAERGESGRIRADSGGFGWIGWIRGDQGGSGGALAFPLPRRRPRRRRRRRQLPHSGRTRAARGPGEARSRGTCNGPALGDSDTHSLTLSLSHSLRGSGCRGSEARRLGGSGAQSPGGPESRSLSEPATDSPMPPIHVHIHQFISHLARRTGMTRPTRNQIPMGRRWWGKVACGETYPHWFAYMREGRLYVLVHMREIDTTENSLYRKAVELPHCSLLGLREFAWKMAMLFIHGVSSIGRISGRLIL